jgi:hypothetical protein
VKKQGKFKSLKIKELKSSGSPAGCKKMLKMQDDPTMCMKKQGLATESRSRNHTFSIKLERTERHYGRFSSLAGAVIGGGRRELSPPANPRYSVAREGRPSSKCGPVVVRDGREKLAGGKSRQNRSALRTLYSKKINKYVRSRNVYENKRTQDTMPEENQTFRSNFSTFLFN